MLHGGGSGVTVQWGATTEVVTGRRLVPGRGAAYLAVGLALPPRAGRWQRVRGRSRRASARWCRLVALGQTGPEIADELGIAHDTVRTHVRNAMDKVGARSRAHLVAKALGDHMLATPTAPELAAVTGFTPTG